MISNFQKRKLNNLFNIHDLNGNGQLEGADFMGMTARLATAYGFSPESDAFQGLAEGFSRFWEGLKAADTNNDGVISYEEWWAWWHQIMSNGLYDQVAKPIGQMIFSMCEPNREGFISKENFLKYFQTITGGKQTGHDVFEHISTNNTINLESLNALLYDYFHSNDRYAKGNWMFGRV